MQDGYGPNFGRFDYGVGNPTFETPTWPAIYPADNDSIFQDSGVDQSAFEALAADMLWNWTRRLFGTHSVQVRPTRIEDPIWQPSSFTGAGPWPVNPGFGSGHSTIAFPQASGWMPVIVNGDWFNIRCGVCGDFECSCLPERRVSIRLPGPVVSVEEVLIDGVVLDPSAYPLDFKSMLIRQDGQPWPHRNNLDLPPTVIPDSGDPHFERKQTWQVTFTKGIAVPVGGQIACGILASELAKAIYDQGNCNLPLRMQTITRDGISVELAQPFQRITSSTKSALDDPAKSPTGIWLIDTWIDGVNIQRPYSSVRSVDRPGSDKWRY